MEMFILSKKQIRKHAKNELVIRDITRLFYDQSNRPKKTPLHLSAIQRRLEEKHHSWYVSDALKKMKMKKILSSHIVKTKNIRRIIFYYPNIFDADIDRKNQVLKKIEKSRIWIEKYSNPKITKILGKHLHSIVKAEIKAQGFKIVSEGKVRSYKDKKWTKTNHDLDIIAEHKERNLVIGVEIKNTLDTISKKEIAIKINICQELGITPVFACRWLKPHVEDIQQKNGFPWQFQVQMYPLGMEELVRVIQKRFHFKVQVRNELPSSNVEMFEKWLNSCNRNNQQYSESQIREI